MLLSRATSTLSVLFTLLALVSALEVLKHPLFVHKGANITFKYRPKDAILTYAEIFDVVRNMSTNITDRTTNGSVNWKVPDKMEERGGYYFCLRQKIYNATLPTCSKSEFEIKEKEKPKEKPKSATAALAVGGIGSVLLTSLLVALSIMFV